MSRQHLVAYRRPTEQSSTNIYVGGTARDTPRDSAAAAGFLSFVGGVV